MSQVSTLGDKKQNAHTALARCCYAVTTDARVHANQHTHTHTHTRTHTHAHAHARKILRETKDPRDLASLFRAMSISY